MGAAAARLVWPDERQVGAGGDRERRGDPHPRPRAGQALSGRARAIVGRRPLEEAPARHEQPRRGAHDGGQAEGRLVREAGERQQRLRHLAPDRARAPPRGAGRAARRPAFAGGPAADAMRAGNHQAARAGQRPRPGRRQHGPCDQEQADQRRGREAAAQVVEELPAAERGQRVPAAPPVAAGRPGSSQRHSCQSPRIQR